MIVGIGTDIIEIERVKNAISKESFLNKTFTKSEIQLFTKDDFIKYNSFAGNFATKEAVAKALGTGFYNVKPIEIEVLRNEVGAPYIKLYGQAKKIANDLNVKNIFVSISHDKEKAISYVILEK